MSEQDAVGLVQCVLMVPIAGGIFGALYYGPNNTTMVTVSLLVSLIALMAMVWDLEGGNATH